MSYDQTDSVSDDDDDDLDGPLAANELDASLVMRVQIVSGIPDEDGGPLVLLDETDNPLCSIELLRDLVLHTEGQSLLGYLMQRLMGRKYTLDSFVPMAAVRDALGHDPDDAEGDEGDEGTEGSTETVH